MVTRSALRGRLHGRRRRRRNRSGGTKRRTGGAKCEGGCGQGSWRGSVCGGSGADTKRKRGGRRHGGRGGRGRAKAKGKRRGGRRGRGRCRHGRGGEPKGERCRGGGRGCRCGHGRSAKRKGGRGGGGGGGGRRGAARGTGVFRFATEALGRGGIGASHTGGTFPKGLVLPKAREKVAPTRHPWCAEENGRRPAAARARAAQVCAHAAALARALPPLLAF